MGRKTEASNEDRRRGKTGSHRTSPLCRAWRGNKAGMPRLRGTRHISDETSSQVRRSHEISWTRSPTGLKNPSPTFVGKVRFSRAAAHLPERVVGKRLRRVR